MPEDERPEDEQETGVEETETDSNKGALTPSLFLAVPDWKGQYVIREQFRPIAEALVAKYPELKHIRVDQVLFVADTTGTGKDQDKRKKAQIKPIPAKWTEILHQVTRQWYTWLMEFFAMNCSGLRHEQYVALVYHELRHIGLDGKPCAHDIEDWQEMIGALGVDWNAQREDDGEFPDLLAPGVDWDRLMGQRTVQMQIDGLRDDGLREIGKTILSEHVQGFREVLQGDDGITGIEIEGAGRKLSIVK